METLLMPHIRDTLTVEEVSILTGASGPAVRRDIRRGHITAARVYGKGPTLLVSAAHLADSLERRRYHAAAARVRAYLAGDITLEVAS